MLSTIHVLKSGLICGWVSVKLDTTDLQIKLLSKFKFTVDQYSEDHILVRDVCEIVPYILNSPL